MLFSKLTCNLESQMTGALRGSPMASSWGKACTSRLMLLLGTMYL